MSAQTHATPEPAVVEDQLKAARRSISDDKGIRWLDPPTRRGEVPPEIRRRLLGAVEAPSWAAFAAEWGDES